jgi:hypothetical protein
MVFVAGVTHAFAIFNSWNDLVKLFLALGTGTMMTATWLLSSAAVETLWRKEHSPKMVTLIALFQRRAVEESSGLAVVRGSALGLVLLGVDTALIWAATRYSDAHLNFAHISYLGGNLKIIPWALGAILAMSFVQAFGTAVIVGFVDLFARRFAPRAWASLLGTSLILAVADIHWSLGGINPLHWTIAVLLVDYLVLVAILRRFDFLTLVVTIATFAFWWANYPTLIRQQAISPVQPVIGFIMWGGWVAGAALVAFKSPIRLAYGKLAAALD